MLKIRFIVSLLAISSLVLFSSSCRKPKVVDDPLAEDLLNNPADGSLPDAGTPWLNGEGGIEGTEIGLRPGFDNEVFPQEQGVDIQNVLFAYDSSNVEPSERYKVEVVADYLATNGGVSLVIEGHADERGSSDYNLALSERRALAVRDYLLSLGVPGDRMTTSPMGEEMPAVIGHDEASWSANRRGEFRFFK